MQTRYMERSNSLAREKRALDPSSTEEGQSDRKRPALASVIVEALKVDSLQKLCSSLEPILRRVVSEEVERALAKLGPAKLTGRSSPKRIEGPDGRNLQLQFRSRLSLPLFTGGKVEGEQGTTIHIVLLDASTGHVVTSGPESSVKLDVVVLEGDFNNEDDDGWNQEEFESHVVKEREGKRPLLTGDLQVTLKEGVGTLGELTFTDNSSWIRSRKFRLGLKVASGYCEGMRIREAKTDAFTVKDHRGELYKKHYPPALNDEVWRLEKIGKDGSFHKRLNKAGIFTVEDFLRLVVRDSQRLRNILGSGMSNKMWDVLVEHAKTCVLSGKLYVYYPDDVRSVGVVFNNIYELSGLIAGGQYHSADSLTENQKVFVDTLVKKAYDNWISVVEYDGKSLLNFNQSKSSGSSQTEVAMGPQDYPNSFDHQLTLPSLPVSVPPQQPSVGPSITVGDIGLGRSLPLLKARIVAPLAVGELVEVPSSESAWVDSISCVEFLESPELTKICQACGNVIGGLKGGSLGFNQKIGELGIQDLSFSQKGKELSYLMGWLSELEGQWKGVLILWDNWWLLLDRIQEILMLFTSLLREVQVVGSSWPERLLRYRIKFPNAVDFIFKAAPRLVWGGRYPIQSQNVNLNAPMQFDGTSFPLQNQLIGNPHQVQLPSNESMLALGPPPATTPGFQSVGTSNLNYRVDDFFPEDEIRMRSHEMLENDDMQHLLRIFNMGNHGHASANVTDDGYPYSSAYMPTSSTGYGFDEDRSRSSGKAVVGWLKLKAALRWGIFVRKKAAERRAQLVDSQREQRLILGLELMLGGVGPWTANWWSHHNNVTSRNLFACTVLACTLKMLVTQL
ncbi:Calmodulin-binding protein 60 C [Vitis vinifera]|uniref:Calmodulin-binding protein 60 C n=1 Tax=Vitis vinifera TaxID=29760 RepID=A0A438EF11_VITVI|nr:Calmodulin-binding protein 60 C [Vitis vinifera]